MHKFIHISFLLLFLSSAGAQDKKYVYRDSSLIEDVQQVEAPDEYKSIEIVPLDEQPGENNVYGNKPADTILYLHKLKTPVDTVAYWKNMKAFEYVKNLDSLLMEMKNNELKKTKVDTRPGLADRFFSSGILKITLWALAVFFILFIIYRLFLTEGVFKKESISAKTELPETEEAFISGDTDFDSLINQAIQNNNYRQAVRYQYLKILYRLADRNFIELSPGKTNYQYVREISNTNFQNDFASLTLSYEYVWYGEFNIDKYNYQKLERNFTGFNQKV